MLGVFHAHALLDLLNLSLAYRGWLGTAPHKARDTRRIAYNVPCLVGELHLDQDIALENLNLNDFALAIFDLDLLLLRDDCIEDFVGHINGLNALADTIGYLFFIATVGVDSVPLPCAVVAFFCHCLPPQDNLK